MTMTMTSITTITIIGIGILLALAPTLAIPSVNVKASDCTPGANSTCPASNRNTNTENEQVQGSSSSSSSSHLSPYDSGYKKGFSDAKAGKGFHQDFGASRGIEYQNGYGAGWNAGCNKFIAPREGLTAEGCNLSMDTGN